MKNYVSQYSDLAKTILGALSAALITVGYFDPSTMTMLTGAAMGFGTAFWQVYDLVTKKQ